MKALVTGGAGFAGSHLAAHLLQLGYNVVLVDRPESDLRRVQNLLGWVKLEPCDLLDFERLRRIMADVSPERIFHLAAFSSVVESLRSPRECYAANFDGTLNLLEAWREIEFDTRVLLVSSSDVYGRPAEREMPLRETSPLRPASHYGTSKLAAELLGAEYAHSHGLHVVTVRPFQHTGPGQSPEFVCSGLARQIAEVVCGMRPPALTVGNPNICRDFSDVRDIVRGYALVLERGTPGEAYQLCSGRAVSVGGIIQLLTEAVARPIEVQIDPSKARGGESSAIWGDSEKARSETGWEPAFQLTATLRDLLADWVGRLRENATSGSAGSQ